MDYDNNIYTNESSLLNRTKNITKIVLIVMFGIILLTLFNFVIIVPVFDIDEKYWLMLALPTPIAVISAYLYYVIICAISYIQIVILHKY